MKKSFSCQSEVGMQLFSIESHLNLLYTWSHAVSLLTSADPFWKHRASLLLQRHSDLGPWLKHLHSAALSLAELLVLSVPETLFVFENWRGSILDNISKSFDFLDARISLRLWSFLILHSCTTELAWHSNLKTASGNLLQIWAEIAYPLLNGMSTDPKYEVPSGSQYMNEMQLNSTKQFIKSINIFPIKEIERTPAQQWLPCYRGRSSVSWSQLSGEQWLPC